MKPGDTSLGGAQKDFPKTESELLQRAADSSLSVRSRGLEDLCRSYWKPIYHYFRVAWTKSNEDAKDLTQAFLIWLMEGETVKRYVPERGSFRGYLKGLLRHFVQHRDDALSRLKRGGGVRMVPLDGDPAPLKHVLADPKGVDPEKAFDTSWRITLLTNATERVRQRFAASDRSLKFQVFEEYTSPPSHERPTYAALAGRHGLKESDVMNYLALVREEIRTELRAELAGMVSNREDLEEEWNAFFGS